MEKTIILHGLTLEQFTTLIEAAVELKISKLLAQAIEGQKKIKYLSRKEVCELLKISLPTLNEWSKLGLVVSHKIGSRVLYRSDEVEFALTKKKYSRGAY